MSQLLYYKTRQLFFITKRGKILLQNESGGLLQNEPFLLQNAAGITKWAVFITKRGRYYKMSRLLQNTAQHHHCNLTLRICFHATWNNICRREFHKMWKIKSDSLFRIFPSNDFIQFVIPSFDKQIRSYSLDEIQGGVLIKGCQFINHSNLIQHSHSII